MDETVQNKYWSLENWKSSKFKKSHETWNRLDDHIVQGHVDQVGTCIDYRNKGNGHTLLNTILVKQQPSKRSVQ
jgi:riboflavin synthase alpha subunit